MIADNIRISQKLRRKGQLSIEKDIMKYEKIKRLMFDNITEKHRKEPLTFSCVRNCFCGRISYLFIQPNAKAIF